MRSIERFATEVLSRVAGAEPLARASRAITFVNVYRWSCATLVEAVQRRQKPDALTFEAR